MSHCVIIYFLTFGVKRAISTVWCINFYRSMTLLGILTCFEIGAVVRKLWEFFGSCLMTCGSSREIFREGRFHSYLEFFRINWKLAGN